MDTTPAIRENPRELALSWQANIDQVRDLLGSQTIPEHLLVKEPLLRGDEFDVMDVFDVLDRISMADGYRLAYVYRYDPMGSSPILYAHRQTARPYASLSEYRSARPECFRSGEKPPECDPMQYVQSDGSALGYLQWILLHVMGRQFYLYWHANYDDATLIATPRSLADIVAMLAKHHTPLSKEQKDGLSSIDPTPEVTIEGDTVTVRLVWFTKWGGFHETWQTLNRAFPHAILESEYRNLLEYQCGMVY